MKLAKLFPRAEIVMISVSAVLFVGCGKAPSTDGSAANAIQAEALRKEVDSLKAKLANAQSRLESLLEQINDGGAPLSNGESFTRSRGGWGRPGSDSKGNKLEQNRNS